jgi:hypothetical protein
MIMRSCVSFAALALVFASAAAAAQVTAVARPVS